MSSGSPQPFTKHIPEILFTGLLAEIYFQKPLLKIIISNHEKSWSSMPKVPDVDLLIATINNMRNSYELHNLPERLANIEDCKGCTFISKCWNE
jgi:hypothetical protein